MLDLSYSCELPLLSTILELLRLILNYTIICFFLGVWLDGVSLTRMLSLDHLHNSL